LDVSTVDLSTRSQSGKGLIGQSLKNRSASLIVLDGEDYQLVILVSFSFKKYLENIFKFFRKT